MQLIPRYLVDERINVVTTEAGFVVEYRPVYSRTLKIYRGVDNVVQFRLLNADQKPVTIDADYYFVAFDEGRNKILERRVTVTDDSSVATRGMFEVTITESDLLNHQQQYLNYNIYKSENGVNTVTYASRDFESSGVIYLDGHAYPGLKSSTEIVNFYRIGDFWTAGSDTNDQITAEPGLNGNEALHTTVIYNSGYIGTIELQVTLDNLITGQNNWTTVRTLVLDSSTAQVPIPVNFVGVFNFIRFKFDVDPTNTITKILIRN